MVLASATEALLCNILALIRKSIKQPLEKSNKPQCPDKGQLSPRSLWVKLSKRIIPTALPLLGCSPTPRPTSGVESQIQAASKNSPNARFLQNQSLLVVLPLLVVLLLVVVLLLLVLLQV